VKTCKTCYRNFKDEAYHWHLCTINDLTGGSSVNTCEDCNKTFVSNFPADKCHDCEVHPPTILVKAAKNRLDLVPPELTLAAGRAFTNGLKKYAPNDWKDKPADMFQAALLRHLYDYMRGEVIDKESGLSALDHVAANLAILIYKDEEK
jgi:hypothetical protein